MPRKSVECSHRSLPSVEAKNELAQVGLQIFGPWESLLDLAPAIPYYFEAR
jgi:hypothetical protein